MTIRFSPLFGLRFKKINFSGDFGQVAKSGGENGILNLVEILAFSIFQGFWWRFWQGFGGEKRMVIFGGENGISRQKDMERCHCHILRWLQQIKKTLLKFLSPYFVKHILFLKMVSKFKKCQFLGQKNGKIQSKIGTPKIDTPKIDTFFKF